MRRLAFVVVVIGAAVVATVSQSAEGADPIDVSTNADAQALHQHLADVGSNLFPCLIEASQAGRSDSEAEAYCFCRNRSFVESHLSQLKALRDKHPEWKARTLKIVSGSAKDRETYLFGDAQITEIESGLKNAAKTCE